MLSPQHIFFEYLRKNKMVATEQRRIVLEVFLEASEHCSSEDLYQEISKRDSTISSATVYRTVKLLVDSGIAEQMSFGDGVVRYESRFNRQHHDHLVCIKCGKKVDVVDKRIEKLQHYLAEKYGFTLNSHKMILYGICPDCRDK